MQELRLLTEESRFTDGDASNSMITFFLALSIAEIAEAQTLERTVEDKAAILTTRCEQSNREGFYLWVIYNKDRRFYMRMTTIDGQDVRGLDNTLFFHVAGSYELFPFLSSLLLGLPRFEFEGSLIRR